MEKLRVLMVDDEEEFVDTWVKRLNIRGLEAAGVYSGQQALDLLDVSDFDVVILDLRMPGMDGIETLKQIRELRPLLPVIMLTGQGPTELGIQGLEICGHNHVVKPVSLDDLLTAIRRAHKKRLEQKRHSQEQ